MKLPIILNYLGFSAVIFCNDNDFSGTENSDIVKTKLENIAQLDTQNANPAKTLPLHPLNIEHSEDTHVSPIEIQSGHTASDSENIVHLNEAHTAPVEILPGQAEVESKQSDSEQVSENVSNPSTHSSQSDHHNPESEWNHRFEHDDVVLDDSRVYYSSSWDNLFINDLYDQETPENNPKNMDYYNKAYEYALNNMYHSGHTPESSERSYSALEEWWHGLWGIELNPNSSEIPIGQVSNPEHSENIGYEQGNSEESRNIFQQAAHALFGYMKTAENHDWYKGFFSQLVDFIFGESHNPEYENLDSRHGGAQGRVEGGILAQIINWIFGTEDKKAVEQY